MSFPFALPIGRTLSVLALSAALGACATDAPTEPVHQVFVPPPVQQTYEDFHFAPMVRAGDFLFLSGVVAGGFDDETIDDEAAYERAFQAIEYFLGQAGAGWEHVVELETFHTDMPAQFDTFAAVKDKYIAAPYPSWTAIDIDRLYPDNALAEIKVVAYLGAPRSLKENDNE